MSATSLALDPRCPIALLTDSRMTESGSFEVVCETVENARRLYPGQSKNGTLYIGVTSDLAGRISIHKQDLIDGFTKRHQVHNLVHVEWFGTMEDAISREKQLKKWSRARKIELIEQSNPTWCDIFEQVTGLREL